jgi:transcription antitermination factor NusG
MQWFALTVKPQHEKAVEEQLKAKSLEGYVPFYSCRRRWSDRTKVIELPLFPRYVFCRFKFEDRLKILSILSVTSIVGFGGTPCAVSEGEIESIKAMVGSGFPVAPSPTVYVGQKVRIVEGALCGLEGVLAREKGGCRVVVNMDLLQRGVAVDVHRDLIAPIGGRELNN